MYRDILRFRSSTGVRYEMQSSPPPSYKQVGNFPHRYHIAGKPCPTHMILPKQREASLDAPEEGKIEYIWIRKDDAVGDSDEDMDYRDDDKVVDKDEHLQTSDDDLVGDKDEDMQTTNNDKIGGKNCDLQTTDDEDYTYAITSSSIFALGGVTALDFDNTGLLIAYVTEHGCLSIHRFDSLLAGADGENQPFFHHLTSLKLGDVKWNNGEQNQLACSSVGSNEILIWDVSKVSPIPKVLRSSNNESQLGITSLAFTSLDPSRLIASSLDGLVYIWDSRAAVLPVSELSSITRASINSIQFDAYNQVVYGANAMGEIMEWDVRGGTLGVGSRLRALHPTSSVQIRSMISNLLAFKEYDALANAANVLSCVRVRTQLIPNEIHSIDLDPSRRNQLAFHLDNGWSGVMDTTTSELSHLHFTPVYDAKVRNQDPTQSFRKPAWLTTHSKYVVGGMASGLFLMDFGREAGFTLHVHPSESVWHPEDYEQMDGEGWADECVPDIILKTPTEVFLGERITSCAAHPSMEYIVAGAKDCTLHVIGKEM